MLAVVEHEDAGVGHEQLERRHALADERVHLAFHLIGQLGDDHVEAVVDDRLAFGLLHPRLPGVVQRLAAVLNREVDDRRRAAEGRRHRPALEVVGRRRAAETACRDACGRRCRPGSTYLPDASITVSAWHVELGADDGNLFVLDQHVAAVLVRRRDDRAVLDESAHRVKGTLYVARCRISRSARECVGAYTTLRRRAGLRAASRTRIPGFGRSVMSGSAAMCWPGVSWT